MDTFNLHKICIKWPIKPISAQLPLTLVLLRISQILTKIAEYVYKILKILWTFLTLRLQTYRIPKKDFNAAMLLFKRIANV